MKYDYTWRCDCDAEGAADSLTDARRSARKHLKDHTDKTPNWTVFIDQYDLEAGELSGKYWKVIKGQ